MTYADHQSEYHHRGWTVFRSAIPADDAGRWAAHARERLSVAPDVVLDTPGGGSADAFDEGGPYRHSLLNGDTVRAWMPELWGFYLALPLVAEPVVCRPIRLSPYPQSAVNVKLYVAPGGTQGWHRDTNAVTALLYLTDDGHCTIVESLLGEVEPIPHAKGDLLLLQGRRCRHHVPAMPPGTPDRITVPLNLYHPDDVWRPAGIDQIVYGARLARHVGRLRVTG